MRASGSTSRVVRAPSSTRPELGTSRHVHDYAVRADRDLGFPAILNNVRSAAHLVYKTEMDLVENDVISPTRTSLIELEKHLLDLSAVSQATQGIFYMLTVGTGEDQCVRFFESGSFVGFYHRNRGTDVFPASVSSNGYRVYNEQDIKQRSDRRIAMATSRNAGKESTNSSKPRSRLGQVYSRELAHIKKQVEAIETTVAEMRGELSVCMFLQVVRKNADVTKPDHRYVHAIGFQPHEQVSTERVLQDFRTGGSSCYPTLETLAEAPLPLSLQSQMDVLSCLSNDPLQPYPTIHGTMSVATTRVGYMRYLSYQVPGNEEYPAPYMLPASLRSRYIYFINIRESQCEPLLRHAFTSPVPPPPIEETQQHVVQEVTPDDCPRPPPMSRRVTQRVVKEVAGSAPNMTFLRITPYDNFRTKVVEVGELLWRLHSADEDYFIMNAYAEGGELVLTSFVEVTYQTSSNHITCTCDVFNAISGITSIQGQDVLPTGLSCMHCRFFKEEIQPRLHLSRSDHSSDEHSLLEQKLVRARTHVNQPVVCLSKGPGTSKYSVRPITGEACALVNISSSGIMTMCTKGTCQATRRHKRSVSCLLKLNEVSSLCEHLGTMHANREVWAPEHPPAETTEEEEEPEDTETMDLNFVDFGVASHEQTIPTPQKFFHPETGKWDYGGYSVHEPVEEHDLMKSRNIQARMAFHDQNPAHPRDNQTGCFSGMDLIPKIPEAGHCPCGSPYTNEQYPDGLPPVEDFTCTLYMRHAPVQCKVFHIRCLNVESCNQPVSYSGLEHSVFLWSKRIAAPDEVGWDFINRVLSSKLSFSAFCTDMTRMYKSINVMSAPFMHKTTFVSWFFAWCSRMNIDFHAEIDPWCGHNPKYLAGDGTHIGVSFRRLVISPVERADDNSVKVPKHKRFDRVFLPYREGIDDGCVRSARKHLKVTAKAYLSMGELDAASKDQDDHNLLEACSPDHRCKDFLSYFLAGDMVAGLKQALAKFILLLASDAAVTTVLPPRYHAEVHALANCMLTNSSHSPTTTSSFCPELRHVVENSVWNPSQQLFAYFLLYLLDFVNHVHHQDDEFSPAVEIPSSYNPESGVAYYFTEHGNIVRRLPTYQVSSTANHDDIPCEDERCSKRFGRVSLGGWSYLFLWFCPLHGHCYGFHVVRGGEGRKDPFSSIFRYMEEPPREIFYDFACSLNEYCLNREPKFFENTRMWHDIFHGITHLCGNNFKSQRLQFTGVNTEICEQFNSFIQCIKYTGTHLSQSHFTFFIQFMIFVWNRKKTDSFSKRVDLALAGHE